jgi:hypothetical protein
VTMLRWKKDIIHHQPSFSRYVSSYMHTWGYQTSYHVGNLLRVCTIQDEINLKLSSY